MRLAVELAGLVFRLVTRFGQLGPGLLQVLARALQGGADLVDFLAALCEFLGEALLVACRGFLLVLLLLAGVGE